MSERASTHDVCIDHDGRLVIKRFRSWDRGEPAREWAALTWLEESAPGLAPTPLWNDIDADPPVIAMSFLPGEALSNAMVSAQQIDALTLALNRLWQPPPPKSWCSEAIAPNSAELARLVRGLVGAQESSGAQPGGQCDDPLVRLAWQDAVTWLHGTDLEHQACPDEDLVLGQGDSNMANFLWDGDQVRIVDFEDSGPSDRALELAGLVEHISAWSDAGLEADDFLTRFDLTTPAQARLRQWRRLAAFFWMIQLLPDGPARSRNPPGTLQRQARRLLTLLG